MESTTQSPEIISALPQRQHGPVWLRVLSRFWAYFFFLILIIFFTLGNPAFFSIESAMNVLTTATPVMLLAIGQTFVIITAGIDLSVGWTMGLGSVTGALVMRGLFDSGMPELPALAIGAVVGILVCIIPGLVNGLLIARVNVPAFIATLGMYSIVRGIALLLSGGNTVASLPPHLGNLGNGNLLYLLHGQVYFFQPPEGLAREDLRSILRLFPYPVIVAIIITVIAAFVLSKTRFGRRTYAIGGNKQAAIRAGIPVRIHLIQLYILSAVLAGISGILYTARFTGGSFQAGEANLLDSVAAVVIGGASLFGGTGNIGGTVVGVLIISVLTTGLVLMNVPPFWQFVAVGCVVILAVLIDQARGLLNVEEKS
jgi:ribose/xylose/arabinose/galactoside ABC-type transport system permease subunit